MRPRGALFELFRVCVPPSMKPSLSRSKMVDMCTLLSVGIREIRGIRRGPIPFFDDAQSEKQAPTER